MAVTALIFYLVFLIVAFGVRSLVHYRRTGDNGFRGLSCRNPAEWLTSALLVGGVVLAGVAPVAELLDFIAPSDLAATWWLRRAGVALGVTGIAITVISQYQMGNSWRIGVDTTETTRLMTNGLFGLVRNPIFTGVLVATVGLAMTVPNLISATAAVCVFLGLEMQARWIEEPYLTRVHGARYRAYARAVGRFLPGVGRIR